MTAARAATAVGRTIVREHTHLINGTPAGVFPLLCPVREDDWVDGWAERCVIVRTTSGVAERGCVFLTTDPSRVDVTWVATRHEPDLRLVEYVWVWPGEEVVTLTIRVDADGPGSRVRIRHTVVPLPGADEDALDARWSASAFDPMMAWWERSMNHYLATGQLLRHPR
jgi:hypothetical protein